MNADNCMKFYVSFAMDSDMIKLVNFFFLLIEPMGDFCCSDTIAPPFIVNEFLNKLTV